MPDTEQNRRPIRRRAAVRLAVYAGLLALGLAYWGMIRLGYGLPCVWERNFGFLCPSCGVTQSLLAWLTLDLPTAFRAHPVFAAAIFPIAFLLCGQDILCAVWELLDPRRERRSLLRFLCERGHTA